jgi:di/tricarboxylate transporter
VLVQHSALPAQHDKLTTCLACTALHCDQFVLFRAVEEHHLHTRMAAVLVMSAHGGHRRLLAAYMLATFFVSMWLSNTGME